MTILALRKKLTSYLQVAEDKKIKAIYALLEDEIDHIGRVSLASYNKELEEAEKQYSNGEFITDQEIKKKVLSW